MVISIPTIFVGREISGFNFGRKMRFSQKDPPKESVGGMTSFWDFSEVPRKCEFEH